MIMENQYIEIHSNKLRVYKPKTNQQRIIAIGYIIHVKNETCEMYNNWCVIDSTHLTSKKQEINCDKELINLIEDGINKKLINIESCKEEIKLLNNELKLLLKKDSTKAYKHSKNYLGGLKGNYIGYHFDHDLNFNMKEEDYELLFN